MGTQTASQHNIFLVLLTGPGFEPRVFGSRVQRSSNGATPSPLNSDQLVTKVSALDLPSGLCRQLLLQVTRFSQGRIWRGGGGVPGLPNLPPKCTSVWFFVLFLFCTNLSLSCVSSILDYNSEQGKPR